MDQIFKKDAKEQFGPTALHREHTVKMIVDTICGGKLVAIGRVKNVYLKVYIFEELLKIYFERFLIIINTVKIYLFFTVYLMLGRLNPNSVLGKRFPRPIKSYLPQTKEEVINVQLSPRAEVIETRIELASENDDKMITQGNFFSI